MEIKLPPKKDLVYLIVILIMALALLNSYGRVQKESNECNLRWVEMLKAYRMWDRLYMNSILIPVNISIDIGGLYNESKSNG